MTSFGRGRGILPSKKLTPSFPNNGYTSALTQSSTEKVLSSSPISIFQEVSPPDLHNFGEKLLSLRDDECLFPIICDIINNELCTVDTVDRMVQIVIDRCLWLPCVSKKYADLLNILVSHKRFGQDIKIFTFNSLQKFYDEREDLWKSKKYGKNTFRNVVILTGEVWYRYRLKTTRFRFLSQPMLTYLKMLISSYDEDDVLVFTQQLSWSGSEIARVDEDGFEELMFDVRRCIVNSADYSDRTKWILLLCHELSLQPFENLSENVKKFYQKNLGGNILASICPPLLSVEYVLNPQFYQSVSHFFQ